MIEVMGKPRDTSPVVLASAPKARRMLQPTKDALRAELAERTHERDSWRELAEREPKEATQLSAPLLLAIGAIVGVVCMAVAGWAL